MSNDTDLDKVWVKWFGPHRSLIRRLCVVFFFGVILPLLVYTTGSILSPKGVWYFKIAVGVGFVVAFVAVLLGLIFLINWVLNGSD